MADKYYSIITNTGKALEAAALANGTTITLSHFVVGDGSGKELVPDAASTKLVNEKYRQKIAMLSVSPEQANQLMAQLVIPSEVGGFTVREIGLLTDKGELYALANCAAIEKPVGGINISMQFRLAVSDTANITLQVATGDGLFLRMDRNLSDVKDVSTARTNLGLKTAALRDVGTDAGQVMPVGAFGVGGQAPKLSNPSNVKYSGFFGYGGNTDPSLKDWGSVISNFYGESGEYCSQLYLPSDQREALIRFMKNGKSVWSNRLYHEGNKPSAADVGAVAKTGDSISGPIVSTYSDTYRIVQGNYGSFWRQDGNALYLLLTNSGDQLGGYNNLRPLAVSLANGAMTFGTALTFAAPDYINKAGVNAYQYNGLNYRQTNGIILQGQGDQYVQSYALETVGQSFAMRWRVHSGSNDGWPEFRHDGSLYLAGNWPGIQNNLGTIWHPDGNIQSTLWGGYLSNWLNTQINGRVDWGSFNQQIGTRATVDWVNQNFSNKNTAYLTGTGWWRCSSTGLIIQWGTVGQNNNFFVSFPITFPNACISVQMTQSNSYYGGESKSNISATGRNNSGFTSHIYSNEVSADWVAFGF